MAAKPNAGVDASASMAETLRDLALLLAGQIEAAADDLAAGGLTPWQMCGTAAGLDRAKAIIHALRRDLAAAGHKGGAGRDRD